MPSMNLSQAVAVVLAGTLWQGNMAALEKPIIKTRHDAEKPISSHGMLSLVEHWREVMVDVELNRDGNPDRLLHYYHRVLNRAQISDREANMLRGFLSQVQIKLGTRKTKKELDHGSES
jgi:tRNA C32,U32 (ribose-2'-O)-methylase TrmJ